jgi:hypothetical protein
MSKETFRKKITIDAEDGVEQYFIFPRLQNYESVEVSVKWTGLDEVGGLFKLQQGIADDDLWMDIPDLFTIMDTDSGTGGLQHTDFGNRDVKFVVDFSTDECADADYDVDGDVDDDDCSEYIAATVGILEVTLIGKMR